MRTNRNILSGKSLRQDSIYKHMFLQLDTIKFGTHFDCPREHFPELWNSGTLSWNFEILVMKSALEVVSWSWSRGTLYRTGAASRVCNNHLFAEKSRFSKLWNSKFQTLEFWTPVNNKCHNISSSERFYNRIVVG